MDLTVILAVLFCNSVIGIPDWTRYVENSAKKVVERSVYVFTLPEIWSDVQIHFSEIARQCLQIGANQKIYQSGQS